MQSPPALGNDQEMKKDLILV